MVCTPQQIGSIIKFNPQKSLVQEAQKMSDNLMTLIHGHNMKNALTQDTYFENGDIFTSRSNCAVSNKDLFARLFQREQMVYTAQGGSTHFQGITDAQKTELNATLDTIRFGDSLRHWMQNFALPAFRSDPMGIVFIESNDQGPYPTYKSSTSIFDYLPNGRFVEYVCFRLTKEEAYQLDITDEKLKDQAPDFVTNYYRFIDDAFDYIFNYENNVVAEIDKLPNKWNQTPAIILSNIISFKNPNKYLSPVHQVLELASTFLNDRSIRDLQKKYHGFLKAIEPLLQCGICAGTGFLSGAACPECTPAGADKGTGYKLRTKVADVARFPLSNLKEGFDFKKIFGYVGPDIQVWDKQDNSLHDIENLIRDVYWGTDNRKSTTGPQVGDTSIEETATKTLANLQPIYARLNTTADWSEATENLIVDFIGKDKYSTFKTSQITYGRYYILETPYELMEEYLTMKVKGASQASLTSTLKRYLHCMYATDPSKLAVELKLVNIEPFVHYTVSEVKGMNPAKVDYFAKAYFSEWLQQQDFNSLLVKKEEQLRTELNIYATAKVTLEPTEPVDVPVAINERITTN